MGRVKAHYAEFELEGHEFEDLHVDPPRPEESPPRITRKKEKKYKYAYTGKAAHENCFPSVGPPMGVVTDFLGASASYNINGILEEIDLPNFGTVSAYDDDEDY